MRAVCRSREADHVAGLYADAATLRYVVCIEQGWLVSFWPDEAQAGFTTMDIVLDRSQQHALSRMSNRGRISRFCLAWLWRIPLLVVLAAVLPFPAHAQTYLG